MGELVDDDTSFKRAVSPRRSVRPDVHSHSGVASVNRGSKVGVVSSTAVSIDGISSNSYSGSYSLLCVEDNTIVALTALSVVVYFEVTSRLRESEGVQKVMVRVGSVEKLRD